MNKEVTWRKASRSAENASCVELSVASTQTNIRDSKKTSAGFLAVASGPFGKFLDAVKEDQFNH